ncbi:MAG: undecaprenyldiphospho-muramoylpentapeptide beta-N-acetylglucosaminyltransferase [Planctomycetota bacterium]|jgi:UDP-N-acetylglucosamine--N-acetylmuramyl-(pentapeptide) pyrophosphoryl-undecaprenol N-acetylglucosamine transferase|nr:undecaprenyldiphospho-muramoylpentapeptide beta-N-acetylglucosaminyltransferase [Planctomycetota bacterium]
MVKPAGILLCGGGTGGHVFPGLAVAAELQRRGVAPLRWVGDPDRIEAKLVPAAGVTLLPFGLSRPRIRSPRWILRSLRQAWQVWRELRDHPPRVVVALGGYASLLPGLLAPLAGRPVVVLEQNARAGRTNRLLARLARTVVTQFPEAKRSLRRVQELGNPVRAFAARERGGNKQLRVLVMGGSLAATSLNAVLTEAAPALAAIPGLHLIHLAGEQDAPRVRAAYAEAGLSAEVETFCHDMAALYERIDLALCRAGATTVSELCAAGIGALYVPLPWAADDHQTANARAVARLGGAVVLPQNSLHAAGLTRLVTRLARERKLVRQLGCNAQRLARPAAAQAVADLVLATQRRAA